MKKILIRIINNSLIFKEKRKLNAEYKNLLNTNFISCNEILFSDEYIINNNKLVTNFINEICKSNNVDTVIIENSSIDSIILDILKNNIYIKSIVLKDNTPLTFLNCERIIATNAKSLSCFALQPFMLELLDKNKILVESRSEILFSSNFMLQNNLNYYSSLFYKITIMLDLPFSQKDEEDFQTFCKINKYLKTIHVNKVTRADLETIVDTLKKYKKRNIKIVIHDNINNIETIDYLKRFSKRYSKKYRIFFKIDYSDSYLQDNLLKQTNNSILKSCGLIIIAIVTATFGFVFYDNYKSMQKVNAIQEDLNEVINDVDPKPIIADLIEEVEPPVEEVEPEYHETIYDRIANEDIASLLTVNPDVAGWIKVNGTNIDYPTVQGADNEYYLKHNIYSEYDDAGWVFVDYRNSKEEINDNLILYAHNRYYNGVMFGTLANTTRSSWYTNPDNQILTYRTLFGTYYYKVFSVYKIQKTSDYLYTQFIDDNDRLEFFNLLKSRSIYDFGIELKGDDKIITLSTCKDKDNRIVLHAVLQKEA